MTGLGHLMGLRVVLKSNRDMLRKTGLFKKDRSFLSSRKEYLKAANGQIDFKTISKGELKELREKVIRNRKAENLRVWTLTLIIMIPIILFGIFKYVDYNERKELEFIELQKKNKETNEILIQQKLTEDLNEFALFIQEGDEWIEKRNWKNAIYKYKKAVDLFPNEFEGNHRLALAYSYRCKEFNKSCEAGKKLTDRLIRYYPNDTSLKELRASFEK